MQSVKLRYIIISRSALNKCVLSDAEDCILILFFVNLPHEGTRLGKPFYALAPLISALLKLRGAEHNMDLSGGARVLS